MDIIVLDTNVASILGGKFNRTESVTGHIAKGHKAYEWSMNLFKMTLLLMCVIPVAFLYNGKELSVEYTQSNTTILPLLLL